MTKKTECVLQMVALVGAIAGLEYYFFRSPDLAGPAQAGPAHGPEAAAAVAPDPAGAEAAPEGGGLLRTGEKHFANIRQLTFGGENAEAYWSFDGKRITFQTTRDDLKADQIFIMDAEGKNPHMVSTGKGRTTCSYFLKEPNRIIYASTHLGGDEPPPPPDRSQGYVWAVYPTYDIFRLNLETKDLLRITDTPGYDAEATVSADGKRIVFTSMRDGDLDLYTMSTRGKDVKRLTRELGYDGGAFFSPDGEWICYRASHPDTEADQKAYRDLLAKNLVKPLHMELYVMRADGSEKRQITKNGAANFCPFFTPDGKRLIFASNVDDPKGRNFELYLVNLDGTGLERLTFDPEFDGFPMFSPDGKRLVWASNRNAGKPGDTNVFVADWVP